MKEFREGIKKILQERGLWHDKDPTPERQGKKWRLDCGADIPILPDISAETRTLVCCARHCLASQPDFRFQRSALQETLLKHKLMFDLYPRLHCESNVIERYWADVKREVRANCDYTYKGLQAHLPLALDKASPPTGPPTQKRKYFKRCKRYISKLNMNVSWCVLVRPG